MHGKNRHPDLYGDEDTMTRADAEALVESLVEARIKALVESGAIQTIPGPQGEPGKEGKQGPKGDDGKEGRRGIQGVEGKEGKEGKQGPRGYPGSDGMSESEIRIIVNSAITEYLSAAASGSSSAVDTLVRQAKDYRDSAETAAMRANSIADNMERTYGTDAVADLQESVANLELDYGRYLNQIRSPSGLVRLKVRDVPTGEEESDSDTLHSSAVLECFNLFAPVISGTGEVSDFYISTSAPGGITTYGFYPTLPNDCWLFPRDLTFAIHSDGSYQATVNSANGGKTATVKFAKVTSGWQLEIISSSGGGSFMVPVSHFLSSEPLVKWTKSSTTIWFCQPDRQMYDGSLTYGWNFERVDVAPARYIPVFKRPHALTEFPLETTGTEGYVTSSIPDYLMQSLVYRGEASSLPQSARTGDMYRLTADSGAFVAGDLVARYGGSWVKIGTTAAAAVPSAETIPVPNQNQYDHTFSQDETVRSALLAIISRVGIALHPSEGTPSTLSGDIQSVSQQLGSLTDIQHMYQYFPGVELTVWNLLLNIGMRISNIESIIK